MLLLQANHRISTNIQRRIYGHSTNVEIRPLNEEKAVQAAADLIGELFVFSVFTNSQLNILYEIYCTLHVSLYAIIFQLANFDKILPEFSGNYSLNANLEFLCEHYVMSKCRLNNFCTKNYLVQVKCMNTFWINVDDPPHAIMTFSSHLYFHMVW